ncbi:hypothetical protein NX862_18695 [Rhodobacter sp. KR11]|uniref:hypothetical protein n=1 Tax=Rhodobacter sp. KR11 TaxID=2974588 RepID=UPI002223AB63|nr:hypothetical protein [Rhodobacter sp. KR11]MCW1920792.1 hypothetical protein [Rhodobacter sp. KR11]
MGNTFAYVVLFGWPLVVLWLFRTRNRAMALCVSIIGGYLLLPFGVGIDFPLLPTLSKDLIPALAAALMVVILGAEPRTMTRSRPAAARTSPQEAPPNAPSVTRAPSFTRARRGGPTPAPEPGWTRRRLPLIFQALVLVLIFAPFLTAASNTEAVTMGPRLLSGLRLYDGFAMAQAALVTLLPFLLGQRLLGRPEDQRILLQVLAWGAVLYSLPILLELRLSPQLSNWFYGFLFQSFEQAVRGFGYRPVVFLQHGLWLAIFMAMAALAGLALIRGAGFGRGPATALGLGLTAMVFLCNSLGAALVFVVLAPLLVLPPRLQILAAALLATVLLAYPMLRGAGLIPVQPLLSAVESLSPDRASSFAYRLRNEDMLLDHANEKPLSGWGGYGRNRVYDAETGADKAETDGAWVIVMGVKGWLGYLATYGLLGGPIIALGLARGLSPPGKSLNPEAAALGLILVANLVDMIPNATMTPLTWLIAGALAGRLRLRPKLDPSQPDATQPPSRQAPSRQDRGRAGRAPLSPALSPALSRSRAPLAALALCLALPLLGPQDLRAQNLVPPASGPPPASGLPPAAGLADPTLALGLNGVSDWSTAMPFLDLMKTARPFLAHSPDAWEAMSNQALAAGGWLDAQGWPRAIPPGMTAVGTIWDWNPQDAGAAASRAGVYVLRHRGRGQLQLNAALQILSQKPGEIIFANPTGGQMILNILTTDPDQSGDHIRDITLVRQEYQPLHDLGQVFDPRWRAVIEDARVLRFKDWLQVDGTTGDTWDGQRLARLDDASYMQHGVPVDLMTRLANDVGAEPWFSIPAGASKAWIVSFATRVRDQMDPRLKIHVEYSNEMWNWAFPQTRWIEAQARAAWNGDDKSDWDKAAWLDYQVMLATGSAQIWDQVFGAEARARLDHVLGAQTGNAWAAARLLSPVLWRARDPAGHVDPASTFDSLAVTTYFGGATMSDDALRADLVARVQADPRAAADWLTLRMLDPDYPQSIPQVLAQLAEMQSLAKTHGLDLVAYEGGQHLLQSFAVTGLTKTDQEILTPFFAAYAHGPQMAELYRRLWQGWAQISDGPFMPLVEVAATSKTGAWGLYTHLGQSHAPSFNAPAPNAPAADLLATNPLATMLTRLNMTQKAWFGTGGGVEYQQGVVTLSALPLSGAAAAAASDPSSAGRETLLGSDLDTLLGTDLDDVLMGGTGAERFIPGLGHDLVIGGGGRDVLILQGQPADYRLTPDLTPDLTGKQTGDLTGDQTPQGAVFTLVGPDRTEPGHTEPGHTGPGHTDSGQTIRFRDIALLGFVDPGGENRLLPPEDLLAPQPPLP